MSFQRASGVLLHPTSLPSRFGIGDLGQAAYAFVDFLAKSGQTLWQVLPLGPTGYEHSPYIMNFSTFAGNPLLIDLEQLAADGLLDSSALTPLTDVDPEKVDFEKVIAHKTHLLKQAHDRFLTARSPDQDAKFAQFCQEQASWLDDFVLFMALLEANGGKSWHQWERAIARREPDAIKAQTEALQASIQYQQFVQFKFFDQWQKLRQYANDKNIKIIGDISIYVCHNSSDVWADPELFKLDPN
ncbi:MAG TPA: 4-alpha-glucanotransferase, partial [Crinalium sp.]